MSGARPPFGDWLGRAGFDTWADYYELLAISRDARDPQAIAAAADRLIARVQACDPGPHQLAREKLLQQLLAAKVCLTDPARRSAYDYRLGTSNDYIPQAVPLPPAPPLAPAPVRPPPIADSGPVRQPAPPPRKPPGRVPIAAGAAGGLRTHSRAQTIRKRRAQQRIKFWGFALLGVVTIGASVALLYAVLRDHVAGDHDRQSAMADVGTGETVMPRSDAATDAAPPHEIVLPGVASAPTDDVGVTTRGNPVPRAPRPGVTDVQADAKSPKTQMTTSPPPMTLEQAQELSQRLVAAKEALSQQQVDVARKHLEHAQQMASRHASREVVSRLVILTHYVEEFWQAVHAQLDRLHTGDEIVIDDDVLAFVERRDEDTIIVRRQGKNHVVNIRPMTADLALVLADKWLDRSRLSTPLIRGAFFAVDEGYAADDARREWRKSASSGEDVAQLMQVLEDDFSAHALRSIAVSKRSDSDGGHGRTQNRKNSESAEPTNSSE